MPESFACWKCRRMVPFDREPQMRVYCPECAKTEKEEKEKLLRKYSEIRKQVMLETALHKMEKAGMYMHEYLDVSQEVMDEIELDSVKLLSADEVIAALVLKSYNIEYMANYKVGSYMVDFLIPSMHVVLELDGDRHALRYDKDSARDINLRAILGEKWEVVRIGTTIFETNPEKLPDAIEAIYAEKKKLREKNSGIIPEYFSRRERGHYAKISPKEKVWKDDWKVRY